MTLCSVYGKCGGCNKLNIDYEEQLKIKEQYVFKLLEEYQINPHNYHGVIPSPDIYGYRNKMEYSFGNEYKDGPLVLGLRARKKKYDVFYTNDCKLVGEDFNKIVSETCEYFRRKNTPFRNYKNHTGFLRNLSVRKGLYTNEILLNLVTSFEESYDEEVEGWVELILEVPLEGKIVSIIQSKTESKANVVKADEMEVLYGRTYFFEKILGLIFKVGPFSFFQTNTKGAEVLYQTALSYADNSDLVYDFYSGTGTISLLLSKKAKLVYGIEILEEAVKAARANAELNGIKNVQFINEDVKDFIRKRESFEKPDYIVVDPPRSGLHPNLIRFIKEKKFEKIIYISCNPNTLIPNMKELTEIYTLSDFHLVDMFPHTDHIEAVAFLN
ncbi:MAG TPA: 23S rRNA (uracil(1939)-C(5))-methyltransferase RlmD [Defluviitoga sp.]|nr:23S rRNA (uracil(1939)-C(5))-methyltransferase RlmD [Defluviitoga sp.]HOP24611.1 23S rRNA (uracil(1939)-C(5))-methyltransferase RlmD [Defluviitoga sp.]HPZ29419.1 23S rRNA (uracil(1939)-C(5))-methyltransferase RlmD [Defluviitoga sp.]HQD63318.1 23S rRNA (uracil(1939)-C(5))-methyltransferase RlmD [Defluviitoga sp.]